MRNLRFALVALAAMAVPALASAQTTSGKMQWAGVGNSFGWWWQASNGNHNVYGGAAYRAGFNIPSPPAPTWMWPAASSATNSFGPAVDIYCVDFLHNANTSSAGYNVYFTKLTATSFANPSSVLTRSNDLTRYLKAAWLITQMKSLPSGTNAQKYVRADIHAAIWQIMSGQPTGVSTNGTNGSYAAVGASGGSGALNWINQANANYTSVNGNEWTVVTDQCVKTSGTNGRGSAATDNCSQEFLTQNVVPEPATMILMGTGLLALVAVSGVFRRPEA